MASTVKISDAFWASVAQDPKAMSSLLDGLDRSIGQMNVTMSQNSRELQQAAIQAVAKWRSAQQSGENSAMMKSLTDIVKYKADVTRYANDVNRNKLTGIKLAVDQAYPDINHGDPEYARHVWQEYAKQTGAPDTEPTLLGDLNALRQEFPWSDSYIPKEDPAFQNWQRIQDAEQTQRTDVNLSQGFIDEAEQAVSLAQQTGLPIKGVLDKYQDRFQSLGGNQTALNALEKTVERGHPEDEATTEDKARLADEVGLRDQLLAGPKNATGGKPQDYIPWFVGSERGQKWATEHGFQLGHVYPAEAGKQYPGGLEIPGLGIYVPGPDDQRAFHYATRELGFHSAEGPLLNRVFGPKSPDKPQFIEVTVPRGGAETQVFRKVDGKETEVSPEDMRKLSTVVEMKATPDPKDDHYAVRTASGDRFLVDESNNIVTSLTEEEYNSGKFKNAPTIKPSTDGVVLEGADFERAAGLSSRAGPSSKTDTIRGRQVPSKLGDPDGSIRIVEGNGGERLLKKGEYTSATPINEPAERQTPAAFARAVEGRSATATANDMASEKAANGDVATNRPAENLAAEIQPKGGYAAAGQNPDGTPPSDQDIADFERLGVIRNGIGVTPPTWVDPPVTVPPVPPAAPQTPTPAPMFQPSVPEVPVNSAGLDRALQDAGNDKSVNPDAEVPPATNRFPSGAATDFSKSFKPEEAKPADENSPQTQADMLKAMELSIGAKNKLGAARQVVPTEQYAMLYGPMAANRVG